MYLIIYSKNDPIGSSIPEGFFDDPKQDAKVCLTYNEQGHLFNYSGSGEPLLIKYHFKTKLQYQRLNGVQVSCYSGKHLFVEKIY